MIDFVSDFAIFVISGFIELHMGADREKFCDYCKHYLHEDDLCALTGRKPAFESECTDYNEKKGVVKKDFNRKESALERTIFNTITTVCVIGLVIFMVYNFSNVVDWVRSSFKDKKEVPEIKLTPVELPPSPPIFPKGGSVKPRFNEQTNGVGANGSSVTKTVGTGNVLNINSRKSSVVNDIMKKHQIQTLGVRTPYAGSN